MVQVSSIVARVGSGFRRKVDEMYTDVVVNAVKEKKDDEQKMEQKIKHEEINQAVSKLKPEVVTADYIDKRVKDIVGTDDMEDDNGGAAEDQTLLNLKKVLSSGMPKKGVGGSETPRKTFPARKIWPGHYNPKSKGAEDPSSTKGQKGSGKGKGKGKGKSKGKGKAGKAKGAKGGSFRGKGGGKAGRNW